MTDSSSVHRRFLLGAAGIGLAAAPVAAHSRSEGATNGGASALPLTTVWVEFFKGQRVWAYASRQSVKPGETLDVMAAGGPGQPTRSARLEVFRLGATGPQKVWVSDFARVTPRGATASGAAIGPGWPPTWGAIDTTGWAPGCYFADIVEQSTATRDVKACFWIVSNPRRAGAVLVRLGTNTYQAYNPWGGYSLYPNDDDVARGLMVTYDRPTPAAFWEYDVHLVAWIENLAASLGGVDYASNFDVHADPSLMDRYPLVITGSHDEYWSMEEFDAFHRRIFKQGRNVAFFGANTAYCQIRYADVNRPPGGPEWGRQIICYKTASDPIVRRAPKGADPRRLPTYNFRDAARRPETMLLGGAFQDWFPSDSPQRPVFRVAAAAHPFFEGTGWTLDDAAAPVVGYEWDNRDPAGDGRRLWDPKLSIDPAIEAGTVSVLLRGEAVSDEGRPGVAESTLYRSPAGAQVFNAGAVRWSWGLGREGFTNPAFLRFNENLVRALSRR